MDDIQINSIFQNSLAHRSLFFTSSPKSSFFELEDDEDYQIYLKQKINDDNINKEEEKSDDKLGGGSSSSILSSNYDSKKSSKKHLSKEEKEKLRKIRNKEAARKSRQKRKFEIEKLLQENRKLKQENTFLRHQLAVSLCYECKKKIPQIINNSSIRSNESTNQLSQSSISSINLLSRKKPITIFTTFVVIFVIFTNFFSQIQIITNNESLTKNSIRKLNSKNFHLSLEEIDNYNYTIAGWFITFGDFYMITHQSMFLDPSRYYFENKGGVRILKQEEALNYKNDTCKNCIVELDQSNFVRDKKSLKFTLILPTRKFWNDSVNNYTYYNYNTSSEEVFYEIDCEVLGMKENRMQAIIN